MGNHILIDAVHPEEMRMAIVRDGRVESFDYESSQRRLLRGNIYLAKITRVEPSLQAAFVDFGADRHGFLAFSEIHPDYYQIPVADRKRLIADGQDADVSNGVEESPKSNHSDGNGEEQLSEGAAPESVTPGLDDALDELGESGVPQAKQYKIQEVIKRRQIVLVQLVKEERGNKGAALTTYLSLAGRYAVLMPNTSRGGGVSRRISDPADRKRLRELVSELDIPDGMGVILRTAGAGRTRAELRRDIDYLLRLWENVRTLTLDSIAPTLVYEEGSMVKRVIRDRYAKDIDSISVSGDEIYREAKAFMRTLMPSHARNVQPYKDVVPIFSKHGIESQLNALYSPSVELPSGGYIVINQAEALVAIDVNSGKATGESHIESTAMKTNLEAVEEISRQLQLRDLAGLIVIDLIDMEDRRNIRNVERSFKEFLKNDRARVQVGRISSFGLVEMSRQRLRSGVLEGTTEPCSMCQGSGSVRSDESLSLLLLRELETYFLGAKSPTSIVVHAALPVVLHILNLHRDRVAKIENVFNVSISFEPDATLLPAGEVFRLEPGLEARKTRQSRSGVPRSADTATNTSSRAARSTISEDRDPVSETPSTLTEEDGGDEKEAGNSAQRSVRSRGRRGGRGGRKRRSAAPEDTVAPQEASKTSNDDSTSAETTDREEASSEPQRNAGDRKGETTREPSNGRSRRGHLGRRSSRGGRRREPAASAPRNQSDSSEQGIISKSIPTQEPDRSIGLNAIREERGENPSLAEPVIGDHVGSTIVAEAEKKNSISVESNPGETSGHSSTSKVEGTSLPDANQPKRRGWWRSISLKSPRGRSEQSSDETH